MIDLINHEYVLSDMISMQRSIFRAKKDHKSQNILVKTFGVFPRAMGQTVSTIGPESDFDDDDDSKLDVASSLMSETNRKKSIILFL